VLENMGFVIRDDGRLHFPGVEFGYGNALPVQVARKGKYLVARTPPRRNWSGVGLSPEYSRAEYLLVEIGPDNLGRSGGGEWFRVVKIIEKVEPGAKWQAEARRLVAKMEELAG